ncbi:hypothetical protein BWI93_05405 [Siphonobacter sp. BAB-5385]|uniref:hypothetical protein n=1 Tax=Siphonobacter sp. BAB-5385 TaxID=1864822 RepID=UPI000B9ED270|nr:hypothetical protein [Siphonobacter sp. BAB-5385]OZI09184.1 hypothetical protein BWI93_05405 [Siphonobacter sp. BAB-5385]
MEVEELLALLTRIEAFRDQMMARFTAGLDAATQELYEELTTFAESLSFGTTETPLTDAEKIRNRQQVQTFRAGIVSRMEAGKYGTIVTGLITDLRQSLGMFDGYFGRVALNFQPAKALYREVFAQGVDRTILQLTGAGMQAEFTGPVINLLDQYVSGGQPLAKLRRNLREAVVEKGLTTRTVKQLASDAVEFATADYVQTISRDVGLKHYLYQGTLIATSRKFCTDRVGKAYTEKEVYEWLTQEWQGKISGTDRQTIFIFRGGYNCRHQLLPISKAMYEYLKSQS